MYTHFWNKPLNWNLSTYQVLVQGFTVLILSGAVLLMLPISSLEGTSLSFTDALFTATSAVCVTGLVVVDTGTYFSLFGQLVILFLIQVGGLGIMTLTTVFAVISGKRIYLKERLCIQEATNQLDMTGVVRLTLYIIKVTLALEFIGGTVLAFRFYQDFGTLGVYYGYWHAISAFCNAGFDLFGGFRSITGYVTDGTVNFMIAGLIITGGIGFPVIADIWHHYANRRKLSLHSKLVLVTTAGLIIAGAVLILLAETSNVKTLGDLPIADKVLASLFQSVTARTAGYNTIDIASLREGTLLVMIFLMFIGASPSSMGGGIKTTTFAVILCSIASSIFARTEAEVFHRQIPQTAKGKAFTVATVSLLLILAITIILSFIEELPALALLFEVTSAFGTVGLSTGITPTLSSMSKLFLVITMFAGRVGTMTLLMAVIAKSQKNRAQLRYPEEKLIVG